MQDDEIILALRNGRKAIEAYNSGKFQAVHKEIVREFRVAIRSLIRMITEGSGSEQNRVWMQRIRGALQDTHTRVDYRADEKLIRDLADIGVTLNYLETGEKKPANLRLLEARLFCTHMIQGE